MAQTIAEMVAASAKKVGSAAPAAPTGGTTEEASNSRGIEIEHQDIQHVQGQAKSGVAA